MKIDPRRTLHRALLDAHRRLEVWRLRRRLLRVCDELERAPADPSQAGARRRHLAQLRDYARRGRFPTNTARPDALVPCIRDASGTLCAVAHMLDASGEGALVDVLAREDNHVVVSALREGPLLRWLARAGITQEEAARIQALYVPPEPSLIIPQALEGIPTDSLELRVAALAAGLLAWLAWRLYRARRASAAAGPLPSPAAPRKEPVAL